jgi:glyoxylase-like metal-dependent hydrolase (beta-lactamase superfamily II)
MAAEPDTLSFNTAFEAEPDTPVAVAPGVVRITANNPGPFTFKGTNTYILGIERVIVVDPGPKDDTHLATLLREIRGRSVEAILLTHTHRDHSALAPAMQDATHAPLWFGGQHRTSRKKRPFEIDWVAKESDYELEPHRVLVDGDVLRLGSMKIDVIATPGHCANHLCFGIQSTPVLLSGDHVMGWNSTMISVPDGSMADYFASLRKLFELPYRQYLPGHGGPIADAPGYARALLGHRELRNEEVIRAVNNGARGIGDLLAAIYPTLAVALQPAARMTLQAHVEYLADAGKIRAEYGALGTKLSPA